jgi:hypothetical protein
LAWKASDNGVCCKEFTEFFWTFSIVLYSKKHDISETRTLSILRWRWGRRPLFSWAQLSRCLLPHLHLRTETDQVSETSCFLEYRTIKNSEKFCEFCPLYIVSRILLGHMQPVLLSFLSSVLIVISF